MQYNNTGKCLQDKFDEKDKRIAELEHLNKAYVSEIKAEIKAKIEAVEKLNWIELNHPDLAVKYDFMRNKILKLEAELKALKQEDIK